MRVEKLNGVAARGPDPVRGWRRGEILRRVPLRTLLAVGVGRLASFASRRLGGGSGAMIGGRITLTLDPRALRRLCAHRSVVLVTGTNGKTTTTRMISAALATRGPVACNDTGANMPDGLVAAISRNLGAPFAALELDERYFARIAPSLRPDVAVLLNLSSDQLDRFGELHELERALRRAVEQLDRTAVVANSKDLLVSSIATAAPHRSWVSAVSASWAAEGNVCPRCGCYIERGDSGQWKCECGLAEPDPDWLLEDSRLRHRDGKQTPIEVAVPGDFNLTNAAMAVAAAETVGADPTAAAEAIGGVTGVQGRYRTVPYGGHTIRLLLAKNPAGWAETLGIVGDTTGAVVIAVNSREGDGRDLSWLWDVPFETLRDRTVVVSGERVDELAVRLTYAEVPYTAEPDPIAAIDAAAEEEVELVANYTAFNGVTGRLNVA